MFVINIEDSHQTSSHSLQRPAGSWTEMGRKRVHQLTGAAMGALGYGCLGLLLAHRVTAIAMEALAAAPEHPLNELPILLFRPLLPIGGAAIGAIAGIVAMK